MIASMVRVCDVDADGAAPIVIGDDVWLAHGVIVEPGVTIGAGSVVSAGSVVRRDIPPRSLAAGNPVTCTPLVAGARARPA
jgi:maltose O-acetyltransferase